MAARKEAKKPTILKSKVVSGDWKEIYADSAFINIDNYTGRISFLSHLPDLKDENSIIESRNVDIIIPKKALIELAEALNSIIANNTAEEHENDS